MTRRSRKRVYLYAGVVTVCAVLFFPIYWIVITALAEGNLRSLPPVFWPASPQWSIFARAMNERPLLLWLGNSTLVATGAVVLSMTVSVLAGYSLSRFRLRAGQGWGSSSLRRKCFRQRSW
jgi:multiple sugar transport system permease protein